MCQSRGNVLVVALMNLAIELHARALAQKQDSRWWIPIMISLLCALMSLCGALIGSSLGAAIYLRMHP